MGLVCRRGAKEDKAMTDLELTKRCAERMGLAYTDFHLPRVILTGENAGEAYDPLHDKSQCMDLVIKLGLELRHNADGSWWVMGDGSSEDNPDLLRAIVTCVANLPN
jgi:hypothetical protein